MADITSQSGSPLGEAVSTSSQPTTRRKARVRRRGKNGGGNAGKLGASVGSRLAGAAKSEPDVLPDPYKKQINALTTERYGAAESTLKRQQAQVPSAFDAYRAIIGGIANRQQAQYAQAIQQQGQLGNQLAAGSQGLLAATGQAQAQGAGVTGAAPSAQVNQDAALAAIQRQSNVAALGGLIGNQGAAEGTYLGNRQASSGMLQFQAQADANRALADLKRDKGAYKVTARGQLEAAAAAAQADADKNRLAAQIAGINAADDAADNALNVKKVRIQNRQKKTDQKLAADRLTVSQQQAADRQVAADRKDKRQTRIRNRTASRKVATRLDDINETWRNLRKGDGLHPEEQQTINAGGVKVKVPTVRKMSHDELVSALEGKGYKTTEIRLARLVARKKTFSKHDMQIARNLGFIVPKDLRP